MGAGTTLDLVLIHGGTPQKRLHSQRWASSSDVHLLGLLADVHELLRECDVLLSPSAHEGLSLAHLEALALGVPVVASGAGGTAEIARETAALRHLPVESTPSDWAMAVSQVLDARGALGRDARSAVERHFSVSRMTAGYARLYPRALARSQRASLRDGIVLVINNFSSGGAQSSARRLLLGLRAANVRVRAVVVEEQPEYPTAGRQALCDAGVPVRALPPAADLDPARAVARLLDEFEADCPQAVLLWNVIAEYKLLLADALFDVPVFDVSPGEMYFRSLDRYFEVARRPGLPYRRPAEYGARLRGVVVKYGAEAELAARVLGAPVHVIPNGVPLSALRATRARSSTPLVFGTSARIHRDKKLFELVAALRIAATRLPPYVLRIAGGVDGGSEREAAELARACAGLNVEWLGELRDTRDFLDDLDVFVLAAEPAGCPNASLEAMARGLPVIATDVGGISEQVVDAVTGRLVPRGDAAAFAAALVELASDADKRVTFGSAGRKRIEASFSLERMVTDYMRLCLPAVQPATSSELATQGEPLPLRGPERDEGLEAFCGMQRDEGLDAE